MSYMLTAHGVTLTSEINHDLLHLQYQFMIAAFSIKKNSHTHTRVWELIFYRFLLIILSINPIDTSLIFNAFTPNTKNKQVLKMSIRFVIKSITWLTLS